MVQQVKFFCDLITEAIHFDEGRKLYDRLDWLHLITLAKEHNILPIFMEGASQCESYVLRPEYAKELQETVAIVSAQVKRTNAFLKLYAEFVKEDVHPLVMKGLICRELYGKLADHRPSADEDILIPLTDYKKAKEVLITNGYEPQFDAKKELHLEEVQEVSFIHPIEKLHIELHVNAIGKEHSFHKSLNACFQNVFEDYREVEIGGVMIRTMNHNDHFLFLILHAYKHFVGSGLGIRQMLDILLYQERFGKEIDMIQIIEILQKVKAVAFWADMIHIGNSYFGFDLQAPQKPNCSDALFESMIDSGTFGRRTEATKITASTMRNVREDNLKSNSNNMFVLMCKAIFPSKEYMLIRAPYLEEKPWLLPIEWIKRWGRFFRRNKKHGGNLAVDSMKNSRRRMKMLKKYGLI